MRQQPRASTNTRLCFYLVSLLSIFANATVHPSSSNTRNGVLRQSIWGGRRFELAYDPLNQHRSAACFSRGSFGANALLLRGGAEEEAKEKENSEDEDEEDFDELVKSETIEEEDTNVEDQVDEDDEDESDEEEEEYYDAEDEEEEEEADVGSDIEESTEYDEPLVASPMLQLYATFGVMILSKKVDLYNPLVVLCSRFAFIGYLVILQLFLLYVRIRAKSVNDRTPVTMTNPLNGILQSQLGGAGDSNAMMKNLASSFLSSESTALEYDLKQAKNMQGGLLFNMAFMWFLHFKMNQIQPLLINSLTGAMNMVYSPLFQVYVLGRNLERPFKSPGMPNPAAEMAEQAKDVEEAVRAEATIDEEEDEKEEEETRAEEEESADEAVEEDEEDADEKTKDDSDDEDSKAKEKED